MKCRPDKAIESARAGRPTRKSLRPFLAAHRWRQVHGKPMRHLFAVVITVVLSGAAYSRSLPAVRHGDFDLSDAAVRTKMKQRYGEKVPLDSPVISPAAMFKSEALSGVGT